MILATRCLHLHSACGLYAASTIWPASYVSPYKKQCPMFYPFKKKELTHSLTIKRNNCTLDAPNKASGNIQYTPGMKVNTLFSFWNSKFTDCGISEPEASTNYIIAHALGKKTLWNLDKESTLVKEEQFENIDRMCRQRLEKAPVQYVIGEWDFCELVLKMEPPVLIPRPETEHLVNFVCKDLASSGNRSPSILEIGCGSGAISLAILHKIKEAKAVAIDQSIAACELTKLNARINHLEDRLQVHHLELTDELFESQHKLFCEKYDVLVSNPPYVPRKDMKNLQEEVARYEDPKALDGGEDGMDVIRIVLNSASSVLKEKGSVWLEVDTSHPDIIQKLVTEKRTDLKLMYVETLLDFNKKPRFCHLIYDPS
ncbi:hemK methyltransferase family member 1 isoform X2 [Lingula anatina]|uniref:peptide chain release factor N(5)-glutamine methyltransferase n=1 Tax=Lingula anatina TaxID=7574 RepID=A0A1S3J3Q0_LINAN|nr:hemK methyltransferase family member 1 isoform X2 [Lingula anatina]XP_013404889.1 hemK methyltransferase family member 1 isoform X2 [Lingula anatina]|eukprot:XP_013404888.1 hemK methyltransferase family member 1 isoform X2 [Lingula anatina]